MGRRRPANTRHPAPERDTFPKLVRLNAERWPRRVAIREKDLGIWQAYLADYRERSRLIALGLASLGIARGDKVAIVGDNRPELYWAVTAAQGLGGVPCPSIRIPSSGRCSTSSTTREVRFAVVEDSEQVDKLLPHPRHSARTSSSSSTRNPRGMRGYREPVSS